MRPLGFSRYRGEDNIRMDLEEVAVSIRIRSMQLMIEIIGEPW
jgi:hypothetical protein